VLTLKPSDTCGTNNLIAICNSNVELNDIVIPYVELAANGFPPQVGRVFRYSGFSIENSQLIMSNVSLGSYDYPNKGNAFFYSPLLYSSNSTLQFTDVVINSSIGAITEVGSKRMSLDSSILIGRRLKMINNCFRPVFDSAVECAEVTGVSQLTFGSGTELFDMNWKLGPKSTLNIIEGAKIFAKLEASNSTVTMKDSWVSGPVGNFALTNSITYISNMTLGGPIWSNTRADIRFSFTGPKVTILDTAVTSNPSNGQCMIEISGASTVGFISNLRTFSTGVTRDTGVCVNQRATVNLVNTIATTSPSIMIGVNSAWMNITDCEFSNSYRATPFATSSSTVFMQRVKFTNNVGSSVASISQSLTSFTNVDFINNIITQDNTGVVSTQYSNIQFTNVTFIGTNAVATLFSTQQGDIQMDNVSFINSTATLSTGDYTCTTRPFSAKIYPF